MSSVSHVMFIISLFDKKTKKEENKVYEAASNFLKSLSLTGVFLSGIGICTDGVGKSLISVNC